MPLTAIFGGTFNPFHIGHYEMLKALQNDNDIEKILIMPDKIPPHKVCDFMADDSARIKMCEIVSRDFPKAELCLIEFERNGKSYSYDTVMLLKQKYPDTEFTFVCGGDMLVFFDKWYKYEQLMKEVTFTVFKRTDTDENEFLNCVDRFSKMGMKINVMEEIITNVSSTEIRKDFKSAKALLPTEVFNFLTEKRIYIDREI
ncbi:MAG: nicotinate (nicotinamide) nucleotide adenylyltransferase [Clostridia bacterium]|nr:nicotinate (nicotinamide) nucleotide adenylyltransferase [Clostridia bacterium]